MARYSPELIAAVRHDYENTDKSLAQIAAHHGISKRTLCRMCDREGWARRSDRVRDLAPAAQALREATQLLTARPQLEAPAHAKPIAPARFPPPAPETAGGEAAAPDSGLATIGRIERLVERELEAEEAARRSLGSLPRAAADAERCARTLSTLTQTLHALARLRSGLLPENGHSDDMPRDTDEFRRGLAQRIRLFVQSRTGGRMGDGMAPAGDASGKP